MTTVHEIFEIPLRRSNVLSEEDLYCIFVNWQEIIQCNRQFLEDLLDRKSSGSYIFGDIICKHVSIYLQPGAMKDNNKNRVYLLYFTFSYRV